MKSKAILYLLPLIFCLASCQTAITDDMFPGKYALNTDQHKDYIVLNDDYTYQHKYLDSTNKLHTCNGKWGLNFNKTVLSLYDFNSFNAHGIKFKGTWKSFLGMDEDSVRILYSSYVVDDDDVEMHYAMKITDQ